MLIFSAMNNAEASEISIISSKENVGIGEQFYVDVLLDTQGQTYNGLEGSIIFSGDAVSFVRAEEGKSMVTTWIQKPSIDKNIISFAGIMAGGFEGVINPFNLKTKLPGPMVRLVFEGTKQGTASFETSSLMLALSNGEGTIENTPKRFLSVVVDSKDNFVVLKEENDKIPNLEVYVIRDVNLYDNKYALIFQARDKGTGIKQVRIKEGDRDWKEISSPYLLEDQTRHSIINVQAINYTGVSIVTTIEALPRTVSRQYLILLIVGFSIIVFIIRKIYVHFKSKK